MSRKKIEKILLDYVKLQISPAYREVLAVYGEKICGTDELLDFSVKVED